MNGPEHYREAERLLAVVRGTLERAAARNPEAPVETALAIQANITAEAQVHATLALAAATAADQATAYDGDEAHSRSRGWAGVA